MTSKSTFTVEYRREVYLAVAVAILSLLGSATGTFLTFRFESSRWERETRYALIKELFVKRMELMERTIKAFNELQVLDTYRATGNYAWVEGLDSVKARKPAVPDLAPMMASLAKIKDAQGELSTVMALDAVYFGPKTRQATSELDKSLRLSDPWWKVDESKLQAVSNAIGEELYSSLKSTAP